MAMKGNPRDFHILTNNPLVVACMEGKGRFTIDYRPELDYVGVLVAARDLIYAGHILYTHPLAGSVKPKETPYKSLIVSMTAHGLDNEHAMLISDAIEVCKKFQALDWTHSERAMKDFQLIDYTLLAGAINFDALAGLSNMKTL